MLKRCLPPMKNVLVPSVLRPLLSQSSCINVNQIRTTIIMKRKHPVQLFKEGNLPRIKRRNELYDIVEIQHTKPTPDIKCILTEYVEGVGGKGDVVEIKRSLFRNQLYPLKLAIYASPENLAENELLVKDMAASNQPRLTAFAKKTMNKLEKLHLPIPMSGDNPWTLNKQHVKLALRKVGVEVEEHCITLPEEPITQKQDLHILISVNNFEPQKIDAYIRIVYKDPSKNDLEELPQIWREDDQSES
ncbi:39S ribosomal protein L9, mitochondrial [Patella vulgata]|uniref:39S ribosomal protein L9, mitochondrial n=1 Tax=Patella vulgata TaxID=6465 RepID=UPI00217F9B55|nr:39S ribosomal protein L9, mitochondrial [Patella vulgata]